MPYRRQYSRSARRGGSARRSVGARSSRSKVHARRCQFRSVAAAAAGRVNAIQKDTRDILGSPTGTASRTLRIARNGTRRATRFANTAIGDTAGLANRTVKGSFQVARDTEKGAVRKGKPSGGGPWPWPWSRKSNQPVNPPVVRRPRNPQKIQALKQRQERRPETRAWAQTLRQWEDFRTCCVDDNGRAEEY